jgi:hypothetical protein
MEDIRVRFGKGVRKRREEARRLAGRVRGYVKPG